MAYHRTSCPKFSKRGPSRGFKCRQNNTKDQILDSSSSDNSSSKDDKDSKSNSSNDKNPGPFSSNSNNNGNGNDNGNSNSNGSGNGNGNPNNSGSGNGSNNSAYNKNNNGGPPGAPSRVGCQFVNENDGRLQYTGLWTLETKDPTGFTTTTHTTSTAGSQVAVNFNGSMIIVVGIVHPSNETVPPATADYTIDADPPTELPLPVATHDIPNQQFFQSVPLTPGEHTLVINVTSDNSLYTLDYLFVCGSGGPPNLNTTQISDAPREEFVSKTVAIIVSSILGTVFLMLLVAVVYILWQCRRRRSPKRQLTPSPLREWLQRQTLFTSSESIMRNNPVNKDVTPNLPDDALSEHKSKSLPEVPVYRTFAEFDSGFNFPISYRLSTQVSAQVPCSPNAADGHELSPHPALPSHGTNSNLSSSQGGPF